MLDSGIGLLFVRQRLDATLVVRTRSLADVRRGSVSLEVCNRDDGLVYGQLVVVRAETMPVRIGVREKAGLEDWVC